MAAIKSSDDLWVEICQAVKGDESALDDIATYKWYNFYMSTHVEAGSSTDIQNQKLFEGLEKAHPEIHSQIEALIDRKIESLDVDY